MRSVDMGDKSTDVLVYSRIHQWDGRVCSRLHMCTACSHTYFCSCTYAYTSGSGKKIDIAISCPCRVILIVPSIYAAQVVAQLHAACKQCAIAAGYLLASGGSSTARLPAADVADFKLPLSALPCFPVTCVLCYLFISSSVTLYTVNSAALLSICRRRHGRQRSHDAR